MIADYLLYLDPGSGSYLVQILAAAALGVVFFFRNIKLYIMAFFSRFKKKPKDGSTTTSNTNS